MSEAYTTYLFQPLKSLCMTPFLFLVFLLQSIVSFSRHNSCAPRSNGCSATCSGNLAFQLPNLGQQRSILPSQLLQSFLSYRVILRSWVSRKLNGTPYTGVVFSRTDTELVICEMTFKSRDMIGLSG
jgi:hypothetical protein